MTKTVLVTGSEGSLMQAIIPKLLLFGYKVVGVDNCQRYGKESGLTGYDFIKEDLTNSAFVDDLMNDYKFDYVIQGAATIYGVKGFHDRCADILSRDVLLHANVLHAAQKASSKPHIVYISSSMVYENCPNDMFGLSSKESMPNEYPPMKTDYGLSKYVCERMTYAFHKQYGLNFTIWRPFNIITPHEKAEGEVGISHVFADYISNIVVKKLAPLPIIGDGMQIRCFTWIDDVATCIISNLERAPAINETLNIGNKEPITMRQLAGYIEAAAKVKNLLPHDYKLEFQTRDYFMDDVVCRVPDVSKTRMLLGWEAQTKVRESITNCLNEIDLTIDDAV